MKRENRLQRRSISLALTIILNCVSLNHLQAKEIAPLATSSPIKQIHADLKALQQTHAHLFYQAQDMYAIVARESQASLQTMSLVLTSLSLMQDVMNRLSLAEQNQLKKRWHQWLQSNKMTLQHQLEMIHELLDWQHTSRGIIGHLQNIRDILSRLIVIIEGMEKEILMQQNQSSSEL